VRRGSIRQLVLLGLVFGAASAAVALLIPWLPPSASKERDRIDLVFWVATVICIFIFTLVASVIAFSVLRFRAQPDDDSDGPPIHGHTGLEIAWTALPTALVTAIAIVSAVVLVKNGRAGPNHLTVDVTAEQFTWHFGYENGKVSPNLVLPVGRSVELMIRSKDVLHSFWVPEFGQKQDAVPGTLQKLVITPTTTGPYPVICTELCGLGHSTMRAFAIVESSDAFAKWLGGTGNTATTTTSTSGPSAQGAAVFTEQGCGSCHALAAAHSTGKVGPDLDQLPAEAKRAGQPLAAFVRDSIIKPNAYVEPGFTKDVMPQNFGAEISTAQLDALVQYLVESSSKGGK
jgi:cytochrome c oxidase subunit 2